jgi:hypothetical protein
MLKLELKAFAKWPRDDCELALVTMLARSISSADSFRFCRFQHAAPAIKPTSNILVVELNFGQPSNQLLIHRLPLVWEHNQVSFNSNQAVRHLACRWGDIVSRVQAVLLDPVAKWVSPSDDWYWRLHMTVRTMHRS